jgi:tetratricopeptide (TPR) repeat protein
MGPILHRVGRIPVLVAIGLHVLLGCAPSVSVKVHVQADEHYRLAQLYLDKSPVLAENEIRKALELLPDEARYLELLAMIHQTQRRLNLAEDACRLALKQAEVPPSVLVNCSALLLYRNLVDETLTLAQRSSRVEEAITLMQRALRHPGYGKPAQAYTNLGLAYFQKADWLREKGDVSQEKEALRQAAEHLRKALEYYTDLPQVYHSLGRVYYRLEKYAEAIREFREVIRLQPSHAGAHFDLGRALLEGGRKDEAIREFREAIRLQPSSVEAHFRLGQTLLEEGRQDEARVAFERVIALAPDSAMAVDLRRQLKLLTP